MTDLNAHINTAEKFTGHSDTMPVVDRSQHVNLGLEIAQRAAQQNQAAPEPIKAMPPIMPVAN